MSGSGDRREQEEPRVVVRDKRRIDPDSGEVRSAAEMAAADGTQGDGGPGPVPFDPAVADPASFDAGPPPAAPGDDLRAELSERTADLQRLKAEFDNYRKRVERDRVAVAEQAQGGVLAQLVPILDDIDRARSHDEVSGGFKVVADALDAVVAKLGLQRFGDEGDPFDPALHEAVMHSESPDVDGPTCVTVMRAGFQFRDRLLRPAMVAVAEPPAGETLDLAAFEADLDEVDPDDVDPTGPAHPTTKF